MKKTQKSRPPESSPQARSESYKDRYFVPDLSPMDRPRLKNLRPKYVFIAESPHLNEIEETEASARRPLCGRAGQKWWALVAEVLGCNPPPDLSSRSLEDFCLENQLAVLNAVQYPMDPKITAKYPKADPILTVGFSKASGPTFYKKSGVRSELDLALQSLKNRLENEKIRATPRYALGNDALWIIEQAIQKSVPKIPHPSAWWRKGGAFGRTARAQLVSLFQGASLTDS